jgi:HSP20 family protein
MNTNVRLARPLTASQMLDEIFHQPRAAMAARALPMDFLESDTAYLVRAALPGFSKEQVSIELENSTLTLSAQREIATPEGYQTLRSEGLPMSLSRSVALPEKIDSDSAVATFVNGVLELTLPKQAPSKKLVRID